MAAGDEQNQAKEQAKASPFNLDEVLASSKERSARRFPRLLGLAFRLVWASAPRELVASIGLQLVVGVGVAAQLLVGRAVLERVIADEGRPELSGSIGVLVLLAAVTAAMTFANVARAELQRILGELVSRHAIGQVLDVSATVDLVAFDSPAFHDRLQRAQVNASSRPLQMVNGIVGMLSASFGIIGVAGALVFLAPLFLVLVGVAYVPAWFATRVASRSFYDFDRRQTERERRRWYLFHTLIQKETATEVRSFELGGYLRARHDALYGERLAELRTTAKRRLKAGLVGGVATSVLTAGTVALLVWFVSSGRLDVAQAGAAAVAVVLLGGRLRALAGSAGTLYEGSLFLEDFTRFVGSLPALVARRPTGTAPPRFAELAVRDLWFSYPSRVEPSLRGVSIDIGAGEVVALVGENGSGKTTLAKILAGLYAPRDGSVTWDGIDTAGLDPATIRAGVSVVFQDFVHWHLAARENIVLGRHDRVATGADIEAAAQAAGAHHYLAGLPQGYDTKLGPQFLGGSDLSGGQWQRLALARAFFRDAPFVILDEPTASLDPRAEADLFERMRTLCAGRAVLLISHRFSSVRSADRIYVLDEGRVIESGSHDQLMSRHGHYAELFTLQASAYGVASR